MTQNTRLLPIQTNALTPLVWTTRDGRQIIFSELSLAHLENILLFMGRRYDHLLSAPISKYETSEDRDAEVCNASKIISALRDERNSRKEYATRPRSQT